MMKNIITVLFALFLSAAFALPVFSQKKVDIFGYYSIVKPPRDFADISMIHLAGDYGASQKPPVYGLVRMTNERAKDFRLLRPSLTGKRLTFKTRTVGGIHYEFDGTFTRLDNFPVTKPNGKIVLKGKLSKYRGNVRIAIATLSFSYEAGD
jgi:hypothetical protein